MKVMTEGRKYHFIPLKPKNKFEGICLLLRGVHMDFLLTLVSKLNVILTKSEGGERGVHGREARRLNLVLEGQDETS